MFGVHCCTYKQSTVLVYNGSYLNMTKRGDPMESSKDLKCTIQCKCKDMFTTIPKGVTDEGSCTVLTPHPAPSGRDYCWVGRRGSDRYRRREGHLSYLGHTRPVENERTAIQCKDTENWTGSSIINLDGKSFKTVSCVYRCKHYSHAIMNDWYSTYLS